MSGRNNLEPKTGARQMPGESSNASDPQSGIKSPSALPFFLLVFVLALPFLIVGTVIDIQPLPGLPIAAAMFVCPALAALILSYRERGRTGVAALLSRSLDGGPIPKRWYLPIVLLVPGATVVSFALERWTGVAVPVPHIAVLPAMVLFLVFMVGALGEELGWSGYALDRLQARWGALQSALLLGGLWAIWHWVAIAQAHRAPVWIAWWSLGAVSMRIILVWVYNRTGRSVFGVALLHAVSNVCWQLFPIRGSFFDPRLNGLVLSVVALAAIVVTRGTLSLARVPTSPS